MNIKKIIAMILCLALSFSLCACIDLSGMPEFPTASSVNEQETPEPEETPEPTATPMPEPTATPEPEPVEEEIEEEPEEPTPPDGLWICGAWYGWWIITSADGEYSDYADKWYDVICTVSLRGEDISFRIDDENGLLGEVVLIGEGEDLVVSESGTFFNTVIGEATWKFSPDMEGYEGFLCLRDVAVTTDIGSFVYSLFLKPWGSDWSDIAENENNTEWFFTDMLPYNYEQYLENVENGKFGFDSFGPKG